MEDKVETYSVTDGAKLGVLNAIQTMVENKVTSSFENIPIDYSWSFSDKTQKDTNYITHGYYTYPAKFIPQLASKLIEEYSQEGDMVVDPFMGSGTTMVESLIRGRKAVGVDINEIAFLVAQAKTTPFDTNSLLQEYERLSSFVSQKESNLFSLTQEYLKSSPKLIPNNDRIDYWFSKQQKDELGFLLYHICENKDAITKNFFLVAFAQILKSASVWMQKSVKPTRDKNKKIGSAFDLFFTQCRKMMKRNEEFNGLLPYETRKHIQDFLNITCCDSRSIPIKDETAQLIITSPPYVTSYEYADLHQLPLLWLGYLKTLPEFRQKFIGSSYKTRKEIDLKSKIAQDLLKHLKNKKVIEVRNYYADMLETFEEMYRILKHKGKACIVIGNTQFEGIDILNAEVFAEQMQNIGFSIHKIIHREIPSKMLPSTRDAETGRFAKASNTNKLAYPTEYILIMEKK